MSNVIAFRREELVTLTVTERVGVNRKGEWITIGVPLPKGKVKSTDELVLLQDGKAIDAEILPVNKCWDNGSLRWVHLIFGADCRANDNNSARVCADTKKCPAMRKHINISRHRSIE